MAAAGGDMWFKLDSATEAGGARINDSNSAGLARVRANLETAARSVPDLDPDAGVRRAAGVPPSEPSSVAYLALRSSLLPRA